MPDDKKRGRPAIPIGDLLIALCLATYFNRPSRKAICGTGANDPTMFSGAHCPSPITLRLAMKRSDLTAILVSALRIVTESVRELETRFAVDSSYYKTPNSMIHVQRLGKGMMAMEKILNAKLHIAVGLKTLMIVAAAVTDEDAHDSPMFRKLLDDFSRRGFRIEEVIADAAYDFAENYEAVKACNGMAYFDQKSNTKENGSPHHDEMVRLRNDDEGRDIWEDAYRFRALIESVNSSMKRTIKRAVRARLETSRENELLLLCLVYNLLRLMEARIKYGVEIEWADPPALLMLDSIAHAYAAPRAA